MLTVLTLLGHLIVPVKVVTQEMAPIVKISTNAFKNLVPKTQLVSTLTVFYISTSLLSEVT